MPNICDYMQWRGDLTFKQSEYNEIDALVLSRFSYFPFDTLIKSDETKTIKELAQEFNKKDIEKLPILWPNDKELFPLMGDSKRFGEFNATKYINIIDAEQEKQLSAITIFLPDNIMYVSFRGTDNTIVGWKEDFNMSFKNHVAAQVSAKKYLEEIANEYPDKKILVGGHSKGGNIAIYASAYVSNEIKDRIIKVYNDDGPGFGKEIVESSEYKEILSKVHTYIPQSSIIGRLMNHKEEYTIVESVQKGVMQHDIYSWKVLGTKFKTMNEFTNDSEFIEKTISKWLENVEPEKREQVIDVVFEILGSTDVKTMKEIKINWFLNARKMLSSYKNIDSETKEMIWKSVSVLLKTTRENIVEEFPRLPRK